MTGPRRYHEWRHPGTDLSSVADDLDRLDDQDALADERDRLDEAERRATSQFDVGEWGDP